jgi:antitoxin VapB
LSQVPYSLDRQEKGGMRIKAKLFVNGRSQAVRIPKEMAFSGVDAVLIEKRGSALILTPARSTWVSFADLEPAADDFMLVRPRLLKTPGQSTA